MSSSATSAFPELPLATVGRVIRQILPPHYQLSREVRAATCNAAGIFILYMTDAATQFAAAKNRQTISAADVLEALEECEFGHLVPELEAYLEAFREDREAKAEAARKRRQSREAENARSSPARAKQQNGTEETTPARPAGSGAMEVAEQEGPKPVGGDAMVDDGDE